MKTKSIWLITCLALTIFSAAINHANAQNIKIDSLKNKVIQILENAKNKDSDYSMELWAGKNENDNNNINIDENAIISVNDMGIIISAKYQTIFFPFFLKYARIDESDRYAKFIYREMLKKHWDIEVAKVRNGANWTTLRFNVKNYDLHNYEDKIAQVYKMAEDFYNTFYLLGKENGKNAYETFEKNYQNSKIAGNNFFTEEQRKFVVQANILNDEKNYEKAIDMYNKAVNINQFSYPQAYYNMALIAAQIYGYNYAILNMKKYLVLVPDADDARKAQDKIYEWELRIK